MIVSWLAAHGPLFDQAVAEGFGDSFGLGVDLQLVVDVTHVEGDGVYADTQLHGRGLVIVAFYEELQEAVSRPG